MPLRLTITNYHKLTPGQRTEFELDRGELKIGRNPENDWILPDPERLVSGQHCVIQLRDDTYYLTDNSTNGVQLVNAGVHIHRGDSEPLRDGERLRVGEYDILVQINDAPQIINEAPATSDPFAGLVDTPMTPQAPQAPQAIPGAAPAPPSREPIQSSGSPPDIPSDLFDFLAPPSVPPSAVADYVPAERHDFRPPEPQPPSVHQASGTGETPEIPGDWDPFAELGIGPTPVAPPTPQAQPQPLPAAAENMDSSTPAPVDPLAAVSTPAPANESSNEVLEAFLRGAGLDQLRIDRDETCAQMEAIGRSYRHMVEGLIEVLRARASLKGEFRMAQTMIRPVENNPLKFAPNVDEALLLLLRAGNQAFMPADQAIKESFDDLKAHQLAVMAGVQASIKHLLKRFQPEVLEARLSKPSGIGALLPGTRQAQCWELFTERYASISREAEDDFEDLFGREFSRAYEEQSAKLRKG
ncbi:type VI secretion system-associated FHA domain protein TagH [Pseudomonas frederiksbergensis]|uniref:FHA domain-containing protein n=1 Tax=Pseudomonas frederiksbergensis TaxID=104087 RepID=A0A423HM32_9PSED|nr:type VI secretion system-associated FHA domain protein TagH [Pseudomonas frederiksbergensis]RON13127.1 FHA domain-containing protein [Pseudomonas frederiksbergensis]RON14257.1 FHA domain-containing protein [Pseudomonas frederiksbergensis]